MRLLQVHIRRQRIGTWVRTASQDPFSREVSTRMQVVDGDGRDKNKRRGIAIVVSLREAGNEQ